jgi:hypothetical protein
VNDVSHGAEPNDQQPLKMTRSTRRRRVGRHVRFTDPAA